jgi:hypothetical protein
MGTFGKASRSLGLALVAAGAFAVPESAQAGCAATLRICLLDASNLPTIDQRSAAGFDCGVEFVGCVRRTVLGF